MQYKSLCFLLLSTTLTACYSPPSPSAVQNEEIRKVSQAPVYRPNMETESMLNWSREAAMVAYTYSYSTYPADFEYASHFFTPTGWESFKMALNASGNLKTVIDNKVIVTADVMGLPAVLSEGTLGKKYSWIVQMPMTIHYKNENGTKDQNVIATLSIVRVKGKIGVYGLAIKDFVVKPV